MGSLHLRDPQLALGNLASKLRNFAANRLEGKSEIVSEWRASLRRGTIAASVPQSVIDQSWIPAPAKLVTESSTTECIFSWSPTAPIFPSLSEALSSPEARRRSPDLQSQARYYLECAAAKLHGVRFGPNDLVEDEMYSLTPEVVALREEFSALEQRYIANPKFGPLNDFGH